VGKLHVRELVVEQEQPPSQGASAQPVVNIESAKSLPLVAHVVKKKGAA
jgi:hypothetical protein